MKLRNKKTGEIVLATNMAVGLADDGTDNWYNSLAELNEDWEDYKPKEPLIKDEKVRKAVRAWADANSLKSFEYADDDGLGSFLGADYERITFNPWRQSGLKDGETYTIAELCGEEEE